jgi:hypothetical protein
MIIALDIEDFNNSKIPGTLHVSNINSRASDKKIFQDGLKACDSRKNWGMNTCI